MSELLIEEIMFLRQMNENRFISDDAYKIAIKEKIIVSERNNKKYQLDYKTDFILNSLNNSTKDANNAFYIQSTINQNIQKIAEKSLLDNLLLFEKKYKKWSGSFNSLEAIQNTEYQKNWKIAKVQKIHSNNVELKLIENETEILVKNELNLFGAKKDKPTNFLNINDYVFVSNIQDNFILCQPVEINGAVVVMDPFNGNILAMVGGVNYKESKFNRAYQASRQPGSSIKPFIYAQALENRSYLPNSIILDSNILLEQGPNLPIWIPKNYSDKSYGEMTFRKALENSNNLVTLKIGLDLGLNSVNNFFDQIRLYNDNQNNDVYSLLLGAIENNLLDITKSYSIFLNGGYIVEPNIIKKVVSDKGELISETKILQV